MIRDLKVILRPGKRKENSQSHLQVVGTNSKVAGGEGWWGEWDGSSVLGEALIKV